MTALIVILILIIAVLLLAVVIPMAGRARADRKLLEMADVFHMPYAARVKYIYLPALRQGRNFF